jgi:hypothetical protein
VCAQFDCLVVCRFRWVSHENDRPLPRPYRPATLSSSRRFVPPTPCALHS